MGELPRLEELSLEGNRLHELPTTLGDNLAFLKFLNLADNQIKKIPRSIGNLGKFALKNLYLHGNHLTCFPSSFVNLAKLDEISLEWFLYAKPPKPKLVKRNTEDGKLVFEMLETLFNLLVKHH